MPTEGLNAEQTEVLKRLEQSHSALERMFDALLDMSQIDAGTLVPQRRTVEPWALMQRLADEAAPAAEGKSLRLALRAGSGAAGVQIHTDPILVERMLRNLIGNAIKYTKQGGVLLACRVRTRGAARQLRLEVWDTGPGIDADHRERIFDEFFRVASNRSSVDGLGLGLPIVRRLARMLAVDVGLSSQPGHGSCFHLSFDLGPPVPTQPMAAPEATTPSLEGLKVGVLEDDMTVRDALSRTLRRWGCQVAAGGSAQELLDVGPADSRSLDVLIVDYRLAGNLTGPVEALSYASAAANRPKVLVVTGEQTPERLQQLARLEVPWLPKPVSAVVLKTTIAGLVAPRPANSGG
jgi:CheY-like chemotaxis protein